MRLRDQLRAHRAGSVLAAAVDLGVVEALRDAPLAVDELARACRVDRDALVRLVRALRTLGVVAPDAGGLALTAEGRALLRGESPAFDDALLAAREWLPAWSRLGHAVADGRPATAAAFGTDTWTHRAAHPELAASFARATAGNEDATAAALGAMPELAACRSWVDVGGGAGGLLVALLRGLPQAHGVLLEAPVTAALARRAIADAGLAERARIVEGSFFEALPRDGDAYVLSHVLHDWDDARAAAILRRCGASMPATARLVVVEHVVPDDGDVPLALALLDLHMLVMHGGRERTRAELEALLAGAGFAPEACRTLRGTLHALVARPA